MAKRVVVIKGFMRQDDFYSESDAALSVGTLDGVLWIKQHDVPTIYAQGGWKKVIVTYPRSRAVV